jgi:steroid 5-alpha reductase family enzyme
MILLGWLAAAAAFTVLWVIQKRTGNAGIVDVAWTAWVGLAGTFFCVFSFQGNATRRWIVALLVLTWAIRLGWHVLQRLRRMPEDGRYSELKASWGDQADQKMFRFYQFQAFAAILFAIPMLIAARNPSALGILDFIGIVIFLIAIGGEALADRQLDHFRQNPANKGKVCQDGLWKFSRHPNYFFEWMHWWSYVLLAITGPWGWVTILAPLSMWHFIVNVTGIPPTEKQALKSRGAAYRRYQQTTSAFFPWFPKSAPE